MTDDDKKSRLLNMMSPSPAPLPSRSFKKAVENTSNALPIEKPTTSKSVELPDDRTVEDSTPLDPQPTAKPSIKANYRAARRAAETLDPVTASTRKKTALKNYSYYLTAEEHKKFRLKCFMEEVSMNEVIRTFIQQYIADEN